MNVKVVGATIVFGETCPTWIGNAAGRRAIGKINELNARIEVKMIKIHRYAERENKFRVVVDN
jgi:hypothetical protein